MPTDQAAFEVGSGDCDLIIMVPVYDDWEAVNLLLTRLNEALATIPRRARLLLVDDGSTQPAPASLAASRRVWIDRLEVLELRCNLGHQRAIAVGLAYVESQLPGFSVLIMDGDGEDDPFDVPRLLTRFENLERSRVVFAARMRRSENWTFRLFYHLYRHLHRALTGIPVRVGNFSVLPPMLLRRLVVVPELWRHYAASVYKARLPVDTVPTVRAPRLTGHSRMNFVKLVVHGLAAISVFGDRVGVRLLVACLVALGLTALIFPLFGGIPVVFELGGTRISPLAGSIVLIFGAQMLITLLLFLFIVVSARGTIDFLPVRDYHYFVNRITCLGDG